MDDDIAERNHLIRLKMSFEEQLSVVRTMFPFVSTKAALQEKHFAKGYACSCRIYAMENREDWTSMKQYLEQALEEYQRSYEEAGTPEAIANLLWALCLGYVFSVDGETAEVTKGEYTQSCYETGMLLIGILREFEEYKALAEYYSALLNFIGMVGNQRRWCYVCEGENRCNPSGGESGKKQGICGWDRSVC